MKSGSWVGVVTVKVEGEFVFEVDETWNADNADRAKALVETELADYIGPAFNDHRFTETWTTTEETEA